MWNYLTVYVPGGRGGGCSPERWRPIREGKNTLLGLFLRLGGRYDLKPPIRVFNGK